MSNPNRLRLVTNDAPELRPEQTRSDERVEDFLDHLCAPLIGIVPYGDRSAFRREARGHLQDLISEYRFQGQEWEAATEAALQEFGDPRQIGRSFLEEWSLGTPAVRPAVLIRRANLVAFAWFGLASMLNLLLLEHGILSAPNGSWFPVVLLLALLSPLLAGGLTGLTAPMQTARGVRNAVRILSIHSFVTGLLLLPQLDGITFALWQGVFWLPAGRAAAVLTVALVRQHKRRWAFRKA